jgi:membrane protease YdiL (CAAX protease family)
VIWAVLWLPIAIPLARLVHWHPAAPISIKQKLSLLASLYLIAPLMVWGVTKVEGVFFVEYGLTMNVNLFQSILFGLVLGILSIILVYGIESRLSWLQWQPENLFKIFTIDFLPKFPKPFSLFSFTSSPANNIGLKPNNKISLSTIIIILPLFAVGLFVGFIEELIFRGVFFNLLLEDYSLWLAAIISSLIFALLHLVWERENTLPQLPGLFLMGMILVGARLINQNSLGLAIGLHAGWVFSLACLDTGDLYFYTEKATNWLAGEKGKPLASVAGIIVLLFSGVMLFLFKIAF